MNQSPTQHRIAILVASALLLSAAPGSAEPPAPSPVGEWSFETGKMNAGCTLSGAMTIVRKTDNTLRCDFNAVWSCDSPLPRAVHSEQTCTAKQAGSNIDITSAMKKIGKVDPVGMTDYMKANYAADHFRVKINTRGDEMRGLFHSYGQAAVIFRRRIDLIG